MAKFVIRLDDICPTMDHEKFARARKFFEAANVRPLLGIVPDNQDPDLQIDTPDPTFWDAMRELRSEGWGISQHGYRHQIHTDARGLLGISPRSEFAGRSFEEQQRDLSAGQSILKDEQLGTDIFMAPFHSYDNTTLEALKSLGFTTLTDGFGLYPWQNDGLRFVPQLFERSANFGVGVYTICLHLNNMNSQEIDELGRFLSVNSARIIDFSQTFEHEKPAVFLWPIGVSLKAALRVKRWMQ